MNRKTYLYRIEMGLNNGKEIHKQFMYGRNKRSIIEYCKQHFKPTNKSVYDYYKVKQIGETKIPLEADVQPFTPEEVKQIQSVGY